MNNFKLIAITPLDGCEEKYRKNLQTGQTYQFYNEYKVTTGPTGKATRIERPANGSNVPESLYELENGIRLSISAVVGKNGTGKSSLFELLLYFIYAVYTRKEYNGRRILNTEYEDLVQRHKEASDLYISLRDRIAAVDNLEPETDRTSGFEAILPEAINFMREYRLDIDPQSFGSPESIAKAVRDKLLNNALVQIYAQMKRQEKEDKDLAAGLAVAILYESENTIREITYDKKRFEFRSFNPEPSPITNQIEGFNVEDFFYTIYLNYSHHGLNSKSIGRWVNKLFHKNDAYFTPVVINPMRTDGKFDINKEISLSKERLMANLLYDIVHNPESKLLGKYKVTHFLFTPKIAKPEFNMPYLKNPIESLVASKDLLIAEGITEMYGRNDYWDFALTYLEKKIGRISERYHFVIFDDPDGDIASQLNTFLLEKKSHITKKIRQTLNFLKMTYNPQNRSFWKIGENTTTTVMTPDQMRAWLGLFNENLQSLTSTELAEFGPPGFFSFDLWLQSQDGSTVKYSDLSSGEQQMIHNSNAILYHLYNINSIQKDITEEHGSSKRIIYRSVNILLDEIELYYHPEMQRRLVDGLVQSFERIKKKGDLGIEAINLTLLTHSPFILSDIPDQNILSLTHDGTKRTDDDRAKTFGGNIHEILIEKFFMDSTIGEHSLKAIQEIVDTYREARSVDNEQQMNVLRENFERNEEKYNFVVNNVGEDVIREILSNNLEFIKFIIGNPYEKN